MRGVQGAGVVPQGAVQEDAVLGADVAPGADARLADGACAHCLGRGALPAPRSRKLSALDKWERKVAARKAMPPGRSLPPLAPRPPPPPEPEPVHCGSCEGRGVVPQPRAPGQESRPLPRSAKPLAAEEEDARPLVAIVGGGLGGLACALALLQRGARVLVFERDSSLEARRQGYGLTIQQGGVALRSMGLSLWGLSPPEHISLAADGRLLGRFGRTARCDGRGCEARPRRLHAGAGAADTGAADTGAASAGSGSGAADVAGPAAVETVAVGAGAAAGGASANGGGGGYGGGEGKGLRGARSAYRPANIILPRQAVREALLAQLPPESVRWGHRLLGAEPLGAGRGWRLRLHTERADAEGADTGEAGTAGGADSGGGSGREVEVEAAVLVGADGLWSQAPGAGLNFLGLVVGPPNAKRARTPHAAAGRVDKNPSARGWAHCGR
ncbi:hypothetical protein T492DRAFT_864417 [Pavlovales sp. CCMP2436]|nr:hypothetical protein T492DRAFT_864417 [Pavlovales sp. CCMP2436]